MAVQGLSWLTTLGSMITCGCDLGGCPAAVLVSRTNGGVSARRVVFVRRVRTASGATAVQIAEYVDGRQRIVRHVGSAPSEAELGILMARARDLLEPDGQDALDLGVEPTPPVAALVAGPPVRPQLFTESMHAGGGDPPVRAGSARVVSTDARVLFEALAGIYSSLGFDGVGDEVFRDLV